MQQLAQEQQQLEEDIIRLAKEAKERQNRAAERALEQAAEASKQARQQMTEGDEQEAAEQQEQARQKLDEAAKQLEEERDRYQDLREEEQLFRMKEELQNLITKQQPITQGTLEVQQATGPDGVPRAQRRKLNQYGEEESELAARVEFMAKALVEEGNLVFQAVLKANMEDLREVSRRLGGRNPDPGTYTTMLQQDVERRSMELIAALDRERERRQQEREEQRKQEQQQQQDQKGRNRFNPQQQRLVSMIADLQMLKTLQLDTRKAAEDLDKLVQLRGDEGITEAEGALIERLGHRHGEVSNLFRQLKAQMEQSLEQMQGEGGGENEGNGNGGGK